MKTVLLTQVALTTLGAMVIAAGLTTQAAISYVTGASLILVNISLLAWTWSKILNKKLVALAVSIIVIKYAIYAVIIYKIVSLAYINKTWFVLGLGTLMPSVLIFAFLNAIKSRSMHVL